MSDGALRVVDLKGNVKGQWQNNVLSFVSHGFVALVVSFSLFI